MMCTKIKNFVQYALKSADILGWINEEEKGRNMSLSPRIEVTDTAVHLKIDATVFQRKEKKAENGQLGAERQKRQERAEKAKEGRKAWMWHR